MPSSNSGSAAALRCSECEEHLADLLDGTLAPEVKARVDAHLLACAACAEFARDVAGAMAVAERSSAVEIPATLIPKILVEITTGPSRVLVEVSLAERIFGGWIRPMLQPRFALGFAMAALSVAIIPLRMHSLDVSTAPTRILTMAENRVYRVYDRTVKNYEDLAMVAEAKNQIDEWRGVDRDIPTPEVGGASANRGTGEQLR